MHKIKSSRDGSTNTPHNSDQRARFTEQVTALAERQIIMDVKLGVKKQLIILTCYENLGPPKILVLGTKFSGKIGPGGPILPEKF